MYLNRLIDQIRYSEIQNFAKKIISAYMGIFIPI